MFTVSRIAVETSKEMDNAKKVYDYMLNKFLGSYLFLKTNDEVRKSKELPNIQRPFISNLRRFYIITQHDYENDDLDSDEKEEYNPFDDLKGRQMKMDKLEPLQFNIPVMLKALQAELPPMPD